MNSLPISKYLIAALLALIVGAPAFADVVFTSEPLTSAAVGRAYSYRMTAIIADKDGDFEDDEDDEDDEDEEDEEDDNDKKDKDDERHLKFIARALPPWLEFDGNDTIFGTPRQEDIGVHRVKLRAKLKGDRVDQEFLINVEPMPSGPPPEGADLAALISVIPRSASVGDPVSWRVTARNLADADVANIVLETAFSGDAAFSIGDVDDSSCSIELRGSHTAVVCRWSPLASGTSRSAQVNGRATGAGEILAVASVSIVDTVPMDRNSANDDATVVLTVPDDLPVLSVGPELTLNGLSVITIAFGETYEDPGATAIDDADGDLTREIVVDNPVDTNVIGRYSVTYDVADSDGNVSTVTRTVEVVPREGVGGGGGGAAGVALLLLVSFCIFARRTRLLLH